MNIPKDLKYTTDHQWVDESAPKFRVGLTDYAQDALGEVVFVKLPDIDQVITAGGSFAEVESTKSVSDIYAPVTGTIVEVNEELRDSPGKINSDPYGEGWICVIDPSGGADSQRLMDADEYGRLVDS